MSEQDDRGQDTPATRTGNEGTPQPIAAAQSLGRYQILSIAGTGGMGRVYVAFDPQLDRRVALKVVLGSGGDTHQKRAAREAKALARLSHPNVVAIHEVNEHDGQLLIAMEFVTGRTLKQWMAEHAPSEDSKWLLDALDVLLQAGRGLAAAHEVKLVHRDFKPSNVLVGEDGRVRVVDFGLARDARQSELLDATGESAGTGLSEQVTHTGAVVGTPAYMAPEQTEGAALDGRTDQYAFCVTAWELLFGVRPKPGEIERPEVSVVPPAVEKVLRKGMSKAPSGRFAGMTGLLGRLEAERDSVLGRKQQSSRWWLLAATVGAGATGAWMSREPDPCVDAGDELAEIWGPTQSEALRIVFLESGVPYAESSWSRVGETVDGYAAQWTAARQDVCEAVQRERSLPTTAGTLGCLAQRRRALAAYLEVVSGGTPEAMDKAVLGAEQLPDVSLCLEEDFVLSGFEAPEGAAAADVAEVREVLARSVALRKAGHYRRAEQLVSEQEARVELTDFPPLSQDYALERASIPTIVGDTGQDERLLLEAYAGASRSNRTAVAVEAASRLALALAGRGKVEAGQRWLRLAEASDEANLSAELRAELCNMRGRVLDSTGNFDGAVIVQTRCLAVAEQRLGDGAAGLAQPLSALGTALHSAGQLAEAEAALERALLLARTLGESHPMVGRVLHAQISLAAALGESERAQSLAAEELPIFRATYGEGHTTTAKALIDAGSAALAVGKTSDALGLFEEADAIYRDAGEFHRLSRSFALSWMADALRGLGRRDEAAERLEEAYLIRRSLLPESHPDVAYALHNFATGRLDQGRFEEALELMFKTRDLMHQSLGLDHPDLELPEGGLGAVLMQLERYAEAVPIFQGQLERIEDSHGPDHPLRAQPLYNLGLCSRNMEDYAKAEQFYAASLEAIESRGVPSNPMLGYPLIGLATVAIADKRPLDAIAFAERALSLTEGNMVLHADAQAALAKGLWLGREEGARARTLADAAQEGYREVGTAADSNREGFERWRDEHGL